MSDFTRITERFQPIFPVSTTRTLRYSTNINIGAAVGAPATWIFRANDLFDPDFTGTGHQPMGFDQLMLWYNHFCVLRAKITCTFRNVGAVPCTCMIRVEGSNTPLTVIDRIIEDGGYTMDTLESKGIYGANKTLSCVANIGKLQAVSRSAMTSDPSLRGDAATSPSEVTYFHLVVFDASAAGTSSVDVDIILEQVAVFMEPRDIPES